MEGAWPPWLLPLLRLHSLAAERGPADRVMFSVGPCRGDVTEEAPPASTNITGLTSPAGEARTSRRLAAENGSSSSQPLRLNAAPCRLWALRCADANLVHSR